ncbi:MAG: hypothetical protein CMF22_11805 [Idiomarinaceae bacterium]|nr:hypothetical protein [Idiomarinaceae bacterium]|tara:strand:+ start:40004 stop:40624 length:621 start_codon:yes stop_codon:yes gene_type:complete
MFNEERLKLLSHHEIFSVQSSYAMTVWCGRDDSRLHAVRNTFQEHFTEWKNSGFEHSKPCGLDAMSEEDIAIFSTNSGEFAMHELTKALDDARVIAVITDLGFDEDEGYTAEGTVLYYLNLIIAIDSPVDADSAPWGEGMDVSTFEGGVRIGLTVTYGSSYAKDEMLQFLPDFDFNNPEMLIRFLSKEESDNIIHFINLTQAMESL